MDLDELNDKNNSYFRYKEGDDCPNCENGRLIERYSRQYGSEPFLGCTSYPYCKFKQ